MFRKIFFFTCPLIEVPRSATRRGFHFPQLIRSEVVMDKYSALALQSPMGLVLQALVDKDWCSWVQTVDKMFYSKYVDKGYGGSAEGLARIIYSAVVWHHGFEQIVPPLSSQQLFDCVFGADGADGDGSAGSLSDSNGRVKAGGASSRTALEYVFLDRWLERLCSAALI